MDKRKVRFLMEDNKKRYEITCPDCGKTQYACKSIAHELGLSDVGHGVCLFCKCLMHLVFNEESDTMTAKKWE